MIFEAKPSIQELLDLLPAVREYQRLAETEGIKDIFQDNGGKLLQVLILTGLENIPGREGNDAYDPDTGREYELKSLNRELVRSFTTHHHLNPTILAKYRLVDWIFAVYSNIDIEAIYLLEPQQLEPLFSLWEERWHERGGRDLNNPKIPLRFVVENGQLLFRGPL